MIIDRLTKSAHFIPVKVTNSIQKLVELYIKEIVMIHRIPAAIVYDRDPWFTSRFWTSVHKVMGTKLNFTMAYYRQTDE
jgi:hypothetical protein